MAQYSYKARKSSGELVTGDLTGGSEMEIITQLRQLEYTPVQISQGTASNSKTGDATPFLSRQISFGTPRVNVRDLMIFCTNLSSMSNAGIPLLNALNVTAEMLTSAQLTAAVRKISQLVFDGSSFSDALAVFPKIFSNFFINMIRTGEMSGTLDKVLNEMAVYLEKEDNLRQTIRGMLIYPMVLLVACTGVVILIITFLMPQFVEIFTKAGVVLPLPTKILYEAGVWVKHYPMYYIPSLIGFFIGIKAILKTKKGKDLFDRLSLKLPVIGSLINKSLVARFSRTLASLLDTGVPLLTSLKILQQVLGNVVYVEIVNEIYDSVEKGEGIHTTLMNRSEFPKDVTYMISVGEKSGNTSMMLNKIANFYENKVQFQVKELMVLIEPTFITIMGAVVGVIMASIILPMFDMIKTVHT